MKREQSRPAELRQIVGFSAADEIENLVGSSQ
jgi:hypothetical protein